MSFFNELKRRNVFKVAIAYLIVSWLVMQISDVMVPTLHLPEWVQTATAYFLIVGFLPAIVFAWAFEMTPEGLRRETGDARNQPAIHAGGQKLNMLIIGALGIAVVLLLADKFWNDEEKTDRTTSSTADAVVEDLGKSIAVLPFTNFSTDEENAFFAAGVHEDILTYLSRVSDLRVNSRTSVMQYADTQLNMKEVAEALGARYILEGSVRRSANRVRVTAQLIDAQTDVHLWAENYDRELTDIFEIQTSVAQEIANALQARLSPTETKLITGRPTESIEAYDLFIKARLALQDTEQSSTFFDTAVTLLEKAVEIDPGYARAWALLAMAHGDFYWFRADPSPTRLEKMKQAVDRAFALQPELPEAYLALSAYYYRGFYDYRAALEQLEKAVALIPQDPLVHNQLGLTYRRLGDYDRSIESFMKATEIDPGHQGAWAEGSLTATSSNRPGIATLLAGELGKRFPNNPRMVAERANTRLYLFGDIEGTQEILDTLPEADHYYLWNVRSYTALFARDFNRAAEYASVPNSVEALIRGGGSAEAGRFLHVGGYKQEAEPLLKESQDILATAVNEPWAQNYGWPHAYYAMTLVLLGDSKAALASCDRVHEIIPVEVDKVHGPALATYCAWVQGMAGNTDTAIDMLEILLEQGWAMNYWILSLNPEWDFLRENERFKQLVAKAKVEMEAWSKP